MYSYDFDDNVQVCTIFVSLTKCIDTYFSFGSY